jgi:hypothetical protein
MKSLDFIADKIMFKEIFVSVLVIYFFYIYFLSWISIGFYYIVHSKTVLFFLYVSFLRIGVWSDSYGDSYNFFKPLCTELKVIQTHTEAFCNNICQEYNSQKYAYKTSTTLLYNLFMQFYKDFDDVTNLQHCTTI